MHLKHHQTPETQCTSLGYFAVPARGTGCGCSARAQDSSPSTSSKSSCHLACPLPGGIRRDSWGDAVALTPAPLSSHWEETKEHPLQKYPPTSL